jgi:hypothetical protein
MHPDLYQRYAKLSEFMFDLRNPNNKFLLAGPPPLIEHNPLLFWQGIAVTLTIVILGLLYLQFARG